MAESELPNPSDLRKFLIYDADTGELFWLPRNNKWWDGRYANTPALASPDRGYRVGRFNKQKLYAHRAAWALYYGEWPGMVIDHINGDKSDNRISNLRVVAQVDNTRNQRRRINNTSGITGVTWDSARRKWIAQISILGSGIRLGRFDDINDAAHARREADRKYGFHANHGT